MIILLPEQVLSNSTFKAKRIVISYLVEAAERWSSRSSVDESNRFKEKVSDTQQDNAMKLIFNVLATDW